VADKRILVDTSILIDFFRKKNKKKTHFFKLQEDYELFVSTVTEFEFLAGVKEDKRNSLELFFKNLNIITFDSIAAITASKIYRDLKSRNQIIEFRDIFIGATALANSLALSTLNKAHFQRIAGLELL